ncbi:tRNA preQ1(34) S-adenosylmethionine ribosyltransferase-isomerase QueA [Candidatus Woesearchaeota archaeon]|nr:tRNA preQ1(34) S-adenosylmethionine ribosyltransferase-isomerase QueA [Candidatus Woesearchaeota archaeon]
MKLEDFDYSLLRELIAQKPAVPRDHSRLLVLGKELEHKNFYDLVDYLKKDDVLVINETKVIPAKIIGYKTSGTKVELIILGSNGKKARCRIKAKNPRIGNKIIFKDYKASITDQKDEEFIVEFDEDVKKIMDDIGILPLPPYVKSKVKDKQYQTAYSRKEGSIAAPTAGLHFTPRLLKKIRKKGVKLAKVVLHVDFGTFLPVRDINKNKLHKEYYEVSKESAKTINNAKRLFVVGTTSVRTLEASNKDGKIIPGKGSTKLFIKPGYNFKTKIDGMITNFHLPRSTLLMLVSAFAGRKKILKAYDEAVKKRYRFFSLGDAMFILK